MTNTSETKRIFKLSDKFLNQYENKQPKWGFGDLSYFIYKRTYSRLKEDGTHEEYYDTVKRVVEGCFQIQLDHCIKFGLPWDAMRAQKSAQKMFDKIWEFKFTPPGRGFWAMGTPIVSKIGSAALQNCAFRSSKDIKKDLASPFAWACDMLMLGVGVGFDTKGAGTVIIKKPKGQPVLYQIPDSREGWVESIKLLINSYQPNNNPVEFDYSLIRPAGTPIKGFGGTSSGPDPLKEGHLNIRSLLNNLDDEAITSTAIVDIMNYIGKFVVAGNVRRSAEICLGDPTDTDYVTMKDPIKYKAELNSHRWASNNSVFADSLSNYNTIISSIAKNGEPGLMYIDNARHYGRMVDGFYPEGSDKYDECIGVNPCAEILLCDGELCNLVESYPANHDTPEEYLDTLKYAYLYAKTITLVPTHDPLANSVMLRNRRIGVSQSGIQQAIKKFGNKVYFKEFCDKGYQELRKWDKTYSRWLGIPTSLRVSTVKPSGTVSLLAGATPGVHCTHSEAYYRTVRIASSDPLVNNLLKAGYKIESSAIEGKVEQITEDNLPKFINKNATLVVYFGVVESNYTKSKFDISLWEQMTLVRELQYYWADNSVSCTITFKKEEIVDMESAIKFFSPHVKTLSFLPLNDHSYEQAPYISSNIDEITDYLKKVKPLKLNKTKKADAVGDKFCNNDVCII